MTMLFQRRCSRYRTVTGMSLSAVLCEIVHIRGSICVPDVQFPVVAPVAVTAMVKKMHRDEANRHGKLYPTVLKPVHAMSPLSDRFAHAIATPEAWY